MSAAGHDLEERGAFAERLRLQFAARHRNLDVEADPARLSLRIRGAGVDVVLPLSPLHLECLRHPERTASLIADFVRASEPRLTPAAPGTPGAQGRGPTLGRVVWCVRGRAFFISPDRLGDYILIDYVSQRGRAA